MTDEQIKALQNEAAQAGDNAADAPTDTPAEKPKKTTRTSRKAKNIDGELQAGSSFATGYRAYYHKMLKEKK